MGGGHGDSFLTLEAIQALKEKRRDFDTELFFDFVIWKDHRAKKEKMLELWKCLLEQQAKFGFQGPHLQILFHLNAAYDMALIGKSDESILRQLRPIRNLCESLQDGFMPVPLDTLLLPSRGLLADVKLTEEYITAIYIKFCALGARARKIREAVEYYIKHLDHFREDVKLVWEI